MIYGKRLPNDLQGFVSALRSCAGQIAGVAVESTFNWYSLVDSLQAAGFAVHLVNTAAVKQYDGLKYSGDEADARHLAHLLRLGILPEGYIYPREERAVRDLLRKRSQLVRQRTTQILSIQNLLACNLNFSVSGNLIKTWRVPDINASALLLEQALAGHANLTVMQCLDGQIRGLDQGILERAKLRADYQALQTVSGIGKVLALAIALETGQIGRFAGPSNFASYARTVAAGASRTARRKAKATPIAVIGT